MKYKGIIVKKHPAQMMGWYELQLYSGQLQGSWTECRAHQGLEFPIGSKAPIVQRYRTG